MKEYMPPGLIACKIGNKKEPVQGPKDKYVTTLYHRRQKIMGRKLTFGYGKILITPSLSHRPQEERLILQENKGTGTIGELTDASKFRYSNDDFVLSFRNIESLDVVLERLEMLKRMMLGQETTIPYQGEEDK